jgi:hypothetical protein
MLPPQDGLRAALQAFTSVDMAQSPVDRVLVPARAQGLLGALVSVELDIYRRAMSRCSSTHAISIASATDSVCISTGGPYS